MLSLEMLNVCMVSTENNQVTFSLIGRNNQPSNRSTLFCLFWGGGWGARRGRQLKLVESSLRSFLLFQ